MTAKDQSFPSASVLPSIPKTVDTIESLLGAADSALYSMKRQRILPADPSARKHQN